MEVLTMSVVKTNSPERDVALVGEDTAEGKKDNSTP